MSVCDQQGQPAHLLAVSLMVLLTVAACGHGHATTVQDLLSEGGLQIESSISPDTGAVAGQKLKLVLQVATDRWFSAGTRIEVPEVNGLVIVRSEQFANNSSESRQGQSWVLQRWTLDVYAQREGDFSIGPIQLSVRIGGGDTDISGELHAPAVVFSVQLPPQLEGLEQWVAAPHFSVEQTFDRNLQGLQPGDAVTREIVFRADDVMAMMLPQLEFGSSHGLGVYPEPPQLDDRSNRGQSSAVRRQQVSYVAETPGRYLLPALEFFWWNTNNGELQLLSLPAAEIIVAAGAAATTDSDGDPAPNWRLMALWAVGLPACLLLAWILYRVLTRLPWQHLIARCRQLQRAYRRLRAPALPQQLNPGAAPLSRENNAVD